MHWKKLACVGLASQLLLPSVASALAVTIQGVRLEPIEVGGSCVNIGGVYPGVRIEADRPGQIPRICHTASRIDSIGIANATLIATTPVNKAIVIAFDHEFPPGVNGKIMARAKLQGFFATRDGSGVPAGATLNLNAIFSQGGVDDIIAEPLDLTVSDSLDSAVFDYSVKEQKLVAGPRSLKGRLRVTFARTGDKLTFPEKCLISLDTGATFEDKLDTIEDLADEEAPQPEGAGSTAESPTVAGQNLPEATPKTKPEEPAAPPIEKLPPFPGLPPLAPEPIRR